MNRDFAAMLSALSEEGAEYLVVGAHALAAHGRPRATVFQIGVEPVRIDILIACPAAMSRQGRPTHGSEETIPMLVLARPALMPPGEGGFEELEIRRFGDGHQPPIRKAPRSASSADLVHEHSQSPVHDAVVVRLGDAL